jgi:hypothetical protein
LQNTNATKPTPTAQKIVASKHSMPKNTQVRLTMASLPANLQPKQQQPSKGVAKGNLQALV